MRSQTRDILLSLLALSLSMTLGCGKKTNQGTTPSPKGTTPQTQAAPAPAPQAPAAPQTPAAPAAAPQTPLAASLTDDLKKTVAEVQAKADAMSVDNLKATALQYKQAILDKQGELEKLTAKIKEIPLTQALGQEATTLKTDVQNLTTSVKALTDRFHVYYDTLKKKGGDTSNLTL